MSERCPHCGHETEAETCPLCGSEVRPAGGSGPEEGRPEEGAAAGRSARRAGPAASDPGAGGTVAWEDPSVPFPADLWRSWKGSLFSPSAFFGRVSGEGSFGRPLLYFLLMTVAGAVFVLLWQTALPLPAGAGATEALPGWWSPEIRFFLAPFAALVGLMTTTLVYHLGALVLAPERRGLGATARVVCYSAGPSVLAAFPILGSLAAWVWMIVLQVVGLREVHRTTTGRALLMVFWLWIALALFLGALIALAVLSGGVPGVPAAGP